MCVGYTWCCGVKKQRDDDDDSTATINKVSRSVAPNALFISNAPTNASVVL